jgi:non-lysosomal glucosylceramidase
MAGEGGLLMCTFPRRDWDYAQAKGKGAEWAAGYFNECMNGFEYQAAGHMLWEGLTLEGLAITRMLHDRYHAARRNPWNEIECGDHYARSMASYGVYLAACGFEYDGPKGRLGFAPRLTPENFKCAFTTAEGWGSFTQKFEGRGAKFEVKLRWGKLSLRSLRLAMPAAAKSGNAKVRLGRKPVHAKLTTEGPRVQLEFSEPVELKAGQVLEVVLI